MLSRRLDSTISLEKLNHVNLGPFFQWKLAAGSEQGLPGYPGPLYLLWAALSPPCHLLLSILYGSSTWESKGVSESQVPEACKRLGVGVRTYGVVGSDHGALAMLLFPVFKESVQRGSRMECVFPAQDLSTFFWGLGP